MIIEKQHPLFIPAWRVLCKDCHTIEWFYTREAVKVELEIHKGHDIIYTELGDDNRRL